MVHVRQQPVLADGSVNLELWLDTVTEKIHGTAGDRQQLQRACELARQLEPSPWYSATPALRVRDTEHIEPPASTLNSFVTGLEMAQILADLRLDPSTLLAAVLYRPVREGKLALAEIERDFGVSVAHLVEGVMRMAAIGSLRKSSDEAALGKSSREQVEHLRKMLLALIDDVRVALIKIAERTCAIRAVKNADETRRHRIAREVKDIYAPLAHRLGIGQLRWELEDLAFRYLEPQAYQDIACLLDERRVDRQKYIEEVIALLQVELEKAAVKAQIKGRAKHIYSIWRKMREKGIGFSQVYDVRAVRILVDTVHECYMVLGMVHGLWHAIPNEFDDYIANPKDNGYRSLHTAVIGPQGKVMEVQIRTHWMNEEAEFGVCAHWQYKDEDGEQKKNLAADYEQKVEWLRQVLEWHEETGGDHDLIEELRSDVIHQKIYVFTPDGDAVEIQRGATPLDFAYHVHTRLGHRCRGARVNGKVVPLHHALKNSDQVEIISGKHEIPNREWLSESLGYITTARARSKIQQWFRQQDRERHIVDGSMMLDREFKRLALGDLDIEQLAQQLNFAKTEDLYVAVGSSDIDMNAVLSVAQQMEGWQSANQQLSFMPSPEVVASTRRSDPLIVGVGNMRTEIAACCTPQKRDAIAGVIHHHKLPEQPVVRVHRLDCEQFLQIQADEPEKVLRISWFDARRHAARALEADLELNAYERTGLLRDITELFDQAGGNILKLSSLTDKASNTVAMTFTIEIASLQKLSALLSRLGQVPNISSVQRIK
jgi:GTP pyrophosphokinase